jgi:nucleolar protein 4
VRYARIVMDKTTGNPAGTGFVCFFDEEDAKNCVKAAPHPQAPASDNKAKQSILQDESVDPEGKYTLDGRLLSVAQAVSKEKAANLADHSSAERRKKDKRKLFLLNEGHIGRTSPIYKLLSDAEIQMRQNSTAQRRKMVEKNPTLHISLTRIALRNIPRNIGSKELKELARKAIVGFAKDVKEGRRQPLSKEENARDSKEAKEQERQRKQKGKGIVRQAKVVFESSQGSKVPEKSGAGRSRGYGFIEYTSHHWALMGLRYLNGLQLEGDNGRKQRLIAEFAIENVQVVQRRQAAENNSGQQSTPGKQAAKGGPETDSDKVTKILKSNKAVRGKGRQKPSKVPQDADVNADEKGSGKPDLKQTLIARKRQMRKKKAQSRG